MASATSKEMEIKLTGVARASLEELLADYLDFIRTRKLGVWDKDSNAAKVVRRLGQSSDLSYKTYRTYIESRSEETAANIIICIIHQANYLLDNQLRQLEKAFIAQGGLRERMTHARLKERNRRQHKKDG